MKPVLFICFAITFALKLHSQPQCISATNLNYDASYGKIFIDDSGNIYESGSFQDTLILGGITHVSSGYNDIYLVKYDPGQNILWSMVAGGISNDDNRSGATVDQSGNIYLGGSFQSSTFILGNDTLHNADLSGLVPNVFFVKLDAAGNFLWSRSTNTFSFINDITTDPFGNVYITGGFRDSPVTFGNFTLNNSGPPNTTDSYIVKYDSSGNVVWAINSNCQYNDAGLSIDADLNNVFLCGLGSNCAIGFGNVTALNSNGNNTYVAKFDFSGNALWITNTGNASQNTSYPSVYADGSGNAYVGGNFNSASLSFGNIALANIGVSGNDGFIAKLDLAGNVLWGQVIGGSDDDGLMYIAHSVNSGITGAYYFSSPAITIGGNTLINAGHSDIAFFEFDSNGNNLWAVLLGGPGDEFASDLATSNSSCFIYGNFNDTNFSLSGCFLSGSGNFLARFDFPINEIAYTELVDNISVYPNPASRELNIRFESDYLLEIFDISGKKISHHDLRHVKASGNVSINIMSLSPGLYFLKIRRDDESRVLKFLKQ